jgi:hypothetical protein
MGSNELRKDGIFVYRGGVRSIWLRHNLETFQRRLKALSAKVASSPKINSAPWSESERRKKPMAKSKLETEHLGYLGAQDTYYVGNIKGMGHIYQQTFIDTYSKLAIVKLHPQSTRLLPPMCSMTV